MKKEKAIRINLPDGAEYRRVEVTDVSQRDSIVLPKPTPLIGGTEVYQKDNGTGYWYCRIKDGRDEFMHLYFGDLTQDDILYNENGKERKFVTEMQKKFRVYLMNALENMPEEGFRWIPVYEPSKNDGDNLKFDSGENVFIGLTSYKWEEALQSYSLENGSRMSSIITYFLLLLRLLKDGFATIEQLADDSKEIGHYRDSENAKYEFEKTGERQLGGLYGLAGNTYKIVKNLKSCSGFSILGGDYRSYGLNCSLASVVPDFNPSNTKFYGIGLLELTK